MSCNHLVVRVRREVMFSQACLFGKGDGCTPVQGSFPGPCPGQGSTPVLTWGGTSVLAGGTPVPARGYPSPSWGHPSPGVPPNQDRTGVSPPKTEQQSEYLLCSWRLASRGHTGDLSCFGFLLQS